MKIKKMGIDEAGRGSLIGPMIIAAVVIDSDTEDKLRRTGVKDSKELSPEKRKELETIIKQHALWYKIQKVYPKDIDKTNLNRLTLKYMKKLAYEALKKHPDTQIIYIDQVGHGKKALIKDKTEIKQVMEEKADSKYIPVAAASILAKVERDRIIDYYRKKYGLKGSGYPSDPETIEWIKKEWKRIPREIIRIKWGTLKKHGIDIVDRRLDEYLG